MSFSTTPIDGEDAKVAWKVEIAGAASDDDPSRIKHDESAAKVDHREVRKAITVNAGDMILSITPPTLGQSGRDIFGKILPAKDGRAKDFDCGEGVRTNEHRTEFFALETGHVAIENQRITVSPVLKVPAVDFNSGNIEYKGRVEVAKDVNEGFKVTAGAEIAIGGDVKDATLKAGKTISAQAFLGKQCKVEAEGDIRVARIVNATVHGKSRLTVMREILNSSIQVTGGINAPEASFVGGEIICLGPVYIGTVGSHTDTAASQRIVIDPAALTIGDLAELTEKIKRFGEQLEKIKAGLGPIAEQRTLVNRLPSEKKGMVTKLIDNLDIIGMHKAMAEKELKEKTEPFNEKVKATVFVKQIYPGTKITLMGVSKIFNEAIPAPMAIALDRATKAIKITPWLKKGEADLG